MFVTVTVRGALKKRKITLAANQFPRFRPFDERAKRSGECFAAAINRTACACACCNVTFGCGERIWPNLAVRSNRFVSAVFIPIIHSMDCAGRIVKNCDGLIA